MKSTDEHDPKLFLAPAGTAAPEDQAEAVDSSAEAMTRLRDPFAVDTSRPDPAPGAPRDNTRSRG